MPLRQIALVLCISKAAEISKPTPKRPWVSYTFLGYYAGTKIGCDQAVRHINTHYTPSVLIILGHISFKEQEIQAEVSNYACLMIPPNINELPAHVKNKLVYGHTGMAAVDLLLCIINKLHHVPVVGISYTLKGRWYSPKVDDASVAAAGKYNTYEECKKFEEFGVPQLICNEKGTEYITHLTTDKREWYPFTYDKSPGKKRTFTYDNTHSLKGKVMAGSVKHVQPLSLLRFFSPWICDVIFNSPLQDTKFTFMTYDVNYDYAPSLCKDVLPGPYRRLRKVKQLLEYFLTVARHWGHQKCLYV